MADKSKDTGTGGININGKVHTMDTGIPDDQVDNTKKYSSGDISVDNAVKDISTPTRDTFAKYLSKATLGQVGSASHKNVYPVGSGADTSVTKVSLKDTDGLPVSPGLQNNESKFNSGFNLTIASNNPAGIKRGLKAGSGPDGNTLLPAASSAAAAGGDYIKFVTTTSATGLNEPIKKYTTDLILPNLFDFDSILVSIPEYENSGAPSGLRSISKTTTFADDAGTSTNILGGQRTLTLEAAAKTITGKTKDNFFPVDEPIVNTKLNVVKLDSSAVLAATGNSKFFKNINIGSYLGVNSKGNLKNQDGNGVFPDGNKLLPEASSAAPSGGDYIKFVTTTSATGLQGPIKTYTTNIVDLNLFDFDDTLVSISDGTLGQVPDGMRSIKIMPSTSTPTTDGGTSKNILGASTDNYTLTVAEARTLAGLETQKNRFPIDNPAAEVMLRDESGNPISVTDAQSSVTNTSFFTKLVENVEGGDKTAQVISRNLSSYTDAFISSQTVDPKFLIKRGKTQNDGVDGNELLLNIASEKDDVATLTEPAKKYTDTVVGPNLRDYSDYTPDKKSANLSGDAQLENLYDLYAPTDLATDGGESKNILDPTKNITFSSLADTISTVTKNNFFPVDSPVVDGKLKDADVASSAKLKPTENSKFFTNIDIGSNFEVNSKGNIVEGSANNKLQDGNKLLLDATVPANSGGKYIKFAKAFKNQKLLVYTDSRLSKNIYIPSDYNVGEKGDIYNLKPENFFGPDALYKPVSGPEDSGTFDNIQKDPSKRAITKEISFQRAVSEVKGENAPGGVGNVYKPAVLLPEKLFNFTTEKGYPISSTALQNTVASLEQYAFPPGSTNEKSNSPELQSSYTRIGDNLSIKRGKSSVVGPDGNTLLKDAAKKLVNPEQEISSTTLVEGSVVNKYVSEVLKTNRFSSAKKFANRYLEANTAATLKNISNDENYDAAASFSSPDQLRMGSFGGNDDTTNRSYNFKRLAHIGTILPIRAAYEVNSGEPGYNPQDAGNAAATILPGGGQAGAGIELSSEFLNVKSLIQQLAEEGIKDDTLLDINTTFQGTVNHALEKFSGFSSISMIALSVALGVAVTVAFEVLSGITTLFNQGGHSPDAIRTYNGRPGIGTFNGFIPKDATNIFSMLSELLTPIAITNAGNKANVAYSALGIYPSRLNFNLAVNRGLRSFFGIGTSNLSAVTSLAAPGHVVTVCRVIIRSIISIGYMFSDMIKAFNVNPLAGVESLFETFTSIRTSKAISVMNILAQIGDIGVGTKTSSTDAFEVYEVTIDGLDAGRKFSAIDSADDLDVGFRYGKSRLKNAAATETALAAYNVANKTSLAAPKNLVSGRLAWAANQAPSNLLIPDSFQKVLSNDRLGANPKNFFGRSHLIPSDLDAGSIALGLNRTQVFSSSDSNFRISTEDREKLEQVLDSEYVPFYFHDVRTNEIIGFHAFLNNLSDDYSASYDTTDAYGRVEAVKIYKNTSRKISVNFVVAALDKHDFETMWVKINKLTTLVYPQYTRGRSVAFDAANSFVRPFTQQISAPPMIRLRIGDVVSSNYSRFNIMGIFGLDSDSTNVGGRNWAGDGPSRAAKDKAKNDATDRYNKEHTKQTKIINEMKNLIEAPSGINAGLAQDSGLFFKLKEGQNYASAANKSNVKPNARHVGSYAARVVGKEGNDYIVVIEAAKGEFEGATPTTSTVAAGARAASPPPANPRDAQKLDINFSRDINNNKFRVPAGYLTELTPVSDKKASSQKSSAETRKSAAETARRNAARAAEQSGLTIDSNGAVVDAPGENSAPAPADSTAAYVDEIKKFLNEDNNVVTKSFRDSGGKGLAGFIDSMSFEWLVGTWETDNIHGRKAPKMCRINISFSPIHDISPGLDHRGHNRAPIYPVGPYGKPGQ